MPHPTRIAWRTHRKIVAELAVVVVPMTVLGLPLGVGLTFLFLGHL